MATVQLPDLDNYIISTAPDAHDAGASKLYIGYDGKAVRRSFLAWDLHAPSGIALPQGLVVSSATLKFWVREVVSSAIDFYTSRVSRPNWNEGQATWNSWATGVAWSNAGGDYDINGQLTTAAPTGSESTVTISGLGPYVQEAVDRRNGILALHLRSVNEATIRTFTVYGKTHGTAAERPLLTVNYVKSKDRPHLFGRPDHDRPRAEEGD